MIYIDFETIKAGLFSPNSWSIILLPILDTFSYVSILRCKNFYSNPVICESYQISCQLKKRPGINVSPSFTVINKTINRMDDNKKVREAVRNVLETKTKWIVLDSVLTLKTYLNLHQFVACTIEKQIYVQHILDLTNIRDTHRLRSSF